MKLLYLFEADFNNDISPVNYFAFQSCEIVKYYIYRVSLNKCGKIWGNDSSSKIKGGVFI